jgi:two-component system LytT family response regulator
VVAFDPGVRERVKVFRQRGREPAAEGSVAVPESSPIRVLIVENDPKIGTALRSLIESEPDMEIVGEASSGREAIDSVRRLAPDVVLLDLDLPETNGIEIVRRYSAENLPATIIIAGHERYAVEAFQVNAFDYIVKPLTEERFHATLDRVRRHLRRGHFQDLSERLEALLSEVRDARNYAQRLWIRSRGQFLIVNVTEIDWVEADAKYSRLHTRDTTHRLRESIGRLEARLDPMRFARIHRSAIVNLDRVVGVLQSDRSPSAILRDGTHIPMSRAQKLRVFELVGEEPRTSTS